MARGLDALALAIVLLERCSDRESSLRQKEVAETPPVTQPAFSLQSATFCGRALVFLGRAVVTSLVCHGSHCAAGLSAGVCTRDRTKEEPPKRRSAFVPRIRHSEHLKDSSKFELSI